MSRTARRLALAAALLALLPWIPGLDGNFARSLASQMGIAAIFAISFKDRKSVV